MMGSLSLIEQTEQAWKRLLESAGPIIGKIWDCEGSESLIETELA